MKHLLIIIVCCIYLLDANAQHEKKEARVDSSFSFVLMSDIHLKPGVTDSFQRVIDTVNKMKVEFVVAAGDLVFDVMRGNSRNADSLFGLYKSMSKKFKAPVYNCIGNHELFGIYKESDIDSSHPDYKYGMYQRYLGKTYYSFDIKGWHFIVLNSIDVNKEKKYYGVIDSLQRDWLSADLMKLDNATPVAVVTHIPFLSVFAQRHNDLTKPVPADPNGTMISNRKEILDLFEKHNLKLVMQGHIHWIEDIFINNKTHFITAGAVAGRPSWRGTLHGERGFMKIDVKDGAISWNYIAY